jgi:hypothetical protein
MTRAFDRLVKKVAPEFVDALPPAEEGNPFRRSRGRARDA